MHNSLAGDHALCPGNGDNVFCSVPGIAQNGNTSEKKTCVNSELETQMHFHDHFDLTTSTHNSMAPVAIAMECLIIFTSFSSQQPWELRRYCLHVTDMAGGVLNPLLFYLPIEGVH